jgi:RNA ligase (TIGR02306 family)
MRQLASIQRIDEVREHPNADLLELATINGWQVVVRKGEFKSGDLAVYFEIDSFLPVHERYEFLRSSSFRTVPNLGDGFRLRTIQLRKELSQGLLMPLSCFDSNINGEPGTDVTDALGVKKWELPIPVEMSGHTKNWFPEFLKKTDQNRVQNCFRKLPSNVTWEIEEKADGSSCTVYFFNGFAGVCGRNTEFKIDDSENLSNVYVKTARDSGLLNAVRELGKSIAVQGELCGPKIQGNKYCLPSHQILVFDIWLIDEKRYSTRAERNSLLSELRAFCQSQEIHEVPYLGSIDLPSTVQEVIEMADGKSALNSGTKREGLVFKTSELVNGQVFSFKSISNKFLLKYKD